METDAEVNALAGMRAAIEYARTMHGGMAGQLDVAAVQEGLDFIAADAIRGGLDIIGAMSSITLRAASLACSLSDQLTVPMFLDLLEAETRGWKAPDQ